MGETVFFKNANLSFRVGSGGDHFINQDVSWDEQTKFTNLLTKLGFKDPYLRSEIFSNILGHPKTAMDIFTGDGFVPFTFHKLVKHLLMIDDSLACSWHKSSDALALSTQGVSYGDLIFLKKKDGDYIRLRVSNHHFINLDYPEQKQGVFEYLGIKTPMAFGRENYGYRPLNEGTGNFPFPHYKKNDWVAATKMAIALVTSARDKMKNTGEVQVKFPTSKLGNPCGEIPLRLQDEIEVKPMSPPTGKLDYLDFTYNYNAKTLRSRLRLTYTPHWTIGNYYPQNTTLTRPRVTSKPYSVPIDSDTIIDTKRREAFTMKLRKNRKTTIR
jgi:hypothetical protein